MIESGTATVRYLQLDESGGSDSNPRGDLRVSRVGPYMVTVLVSPSGKFEGVVEVKVAKPAPVASRGVHDLGSFYDE